MPPRNDACYEERRCKHCGKAFRFLLAAARSVSVRGIYCCKRCFTEDHRVNVSCPSCGIVFRVWRSVPRKYCSKACARTEALQVSVSCIVCGKEYTVVQSRARKTKCCSLVCAAEYFRQTKRKLGLAERKARCGRKEWRRIRNSVIERDGGRCRVCGSTKILAVHHRIPWVTCRDDNPENLITLCKECHYTVEFLQPGLLKTAGIS